MEEEELAHPGARAALHADFADYSCGTSQPEGAGFFCRACCVGRPQHGINLCDAAGESIKRQLGL